jgi:hypothetical protein
MISGISALKCRTRWLAQAAVSVMLAGFIGAAPAMSIREFRALEQVEEQGTVYAQYYLVGLVEGALEASDRAVRQGAKPLFCLNGRRLVPSMALPLYRSELQRNDGLYEADMPVQFVLLSALATVYTC